MAWYFDDGIAIISTNGFPKNADSHNGWNGFNSNAMTKGKLIVGKGATLNANRGWEIARFRIEEWKSADGVKDRETPSWRWNEENNT